MAVTTDMIWRASSREGARQRAYGGEEFLNDRFREIREKNCTWGLWKS
jgi:hypothetical protein